MYQLFAYYRPEILNALAILWVSALFVIMLNLYVDTECEVESDKMNTFNS